MDNILVKNQKPLPRLLYSNYTAIQNLKGIFSENCLTVAWMNWKNLNSTLLAVDKLLKALYFTDLLIVYETMDPQQLNSQLMSIYEKCWQLGISSVMVWTNHGLYIYHPYPSITVKRLENIYEFTNRSYLENFHGYNIKIPTVDFPPRCFNYTNRQGQLIYAGYIYKLISVFFAHHNGTTEYFFADMWSKNFSMEWGLTKCKPVGCAFLPIMLDAHNLFVASWAPFLAKIVLLVPAAKEISESLYLLIPFDGIVWAIVLITGFIYFLLMFGVARRWKSNIDIGMILMEAFKTIIFVALATPKRRNIQHFMLCLLFLFTGLFITNFYTSSLWSLYTSKVYESEMKLLTDIGNTNLKLFIYSLDKGYFDVIANNLPPIIRQRLYTGDDDQFTSYRQNLNMSYIYPAIEDLADYLLLQQMYLRRPKAIKLAEPTYHRSFFISMQLRTPFLQQFNRYFSRLFESGIFNKFMLDAQWDGLTSGKYKLLKDDRSTNEALTMSYFQFAFIMLGCGLGMAVIVFVVEFLWGIKIMLNMSRGRKRNNVLP
ncbi:uncharacterized protein LOC101895943 [Musca domestica]|uniref:Uncharacterized protein LOC101895943 n=1 Tax=Musca domestica TaxID=7370 RepID=A0A9J7HZL5_MUSDO|nr:uncharacterized protein LOC101895943 [Musca domestica]